MDEKQPAFTVTDRRKFTMEGELRDDAPAPAEVRAQEQPATSEKVVTMQAPPDREPAAKEQVTEEPELPQFTAKETAEQHAAYEESSRQLDDMLRQANPGMGESGAISFEHIIQSFYVSAMIAMGAGTEPGEKARIDILGARQSIDMLALLQEKTRGNLTQREEATLQNVLFELRMMFLEITNAIAQSAQRPADGKK
ncbi:MAG TPA: DUF1844 domain-containing protein [Acidobacteriaceae bacterium]|nr:DUF1844 domain-containing protein [Acidobacteriaceae bacterium]